MEYATIERSPDAFQQSIAREHLVAMRWRAFGEEIQIESARELDSGLYNNTYLVETTQPRLLHGNLWTVNILVKRDKGSPTIVAVLDSDHTSWGDPTADWTMFLLQRNAGTEVDAFWAMYGQPEKSRAAQFRTLIYQGAFIGGARLEHYRLHHHETVKRSYRDMQPIIEDLGNF